MAKKAGPRPTKGQEVRKLLAAITGQTADDGAYIGKKIWTRKTRGEKQEHGKVTNTTVCRLEGCGGTGLSVLWKDGRRTYPCAKAVKVRPDGDLEIV